MFAFLSNFGCKDTTFFAYMQEKERKNRSFSVYGRYAPVYYDLSPAFAKGVVLLTEVTDSDGEKGYRHF